MIRLNYIWRLHATGFCFITFSVGGLILAWVIIPAIGFLARDKMRKRSAVRRVVQKSFVFFKWVMSGLGIIEFDTAGAESYLKTQGGKIIIANHPSLIDVVMLISLMPQADCIVKEALWRNPFFGRVIRSAGYIKNSGDVEELIEQCAQSLKAGYSLIIFPEGTRTGRDGELNLQRGASNIALRCNTDMSPVFIHCTPTTLTKSDRWYSIPPRKVLFTVRVGKPFDITHIRHLDSSFSLRARQLTRYMKNYFVEGLKSYE